MSGSRRKPRPLGPFVDGYRAWLLGRGYSPADACSTRRRRARTPAALTVQLESATMSTKNLVSMVVVPADGRWR